MNVPANAENRNYLLDLNFKAVDTADNHYDFSYNQQTIIVDNTPPTGISFHVTSASTELTFNSFYAWDARSKQYTDVNVGAGTNGIKSFTITLKNGSNVIGSNSFSAEGTGSVTFIHLSSNKNYTASVKAIDMAGNSSTKDTIATTAPAKPANLTFSNTTYISTTLSWTPSPGATGYNVYFSDKTLLNSTPITTNSYTIDGLKPDTTYSFYARALSNVGTSDWSDKASIKTLALPPITGPSVLCTGDYTFSVDGLIAGYSISWSNGTNNLRYISSSGTSAVFSVNGTGQGQINASITAPTGQTLEFTKKSVWIGKPNFTLDGETQLDVRMIGIAEILYQSDQYQGVTNVNWTRSGAIAIVNGGLVVAKFRAGSLPGYGAVYATATNSCGSKENRLLVEVTGGWYKIYPNPADNILSVENINNKTVSSNTNLNNKTTTINTASSSTEIRLYDKIMHLKLKKTFNGAKTKINVSNFRPGIYILQIINGKNIYKKEIIISHH